MQTAREAVLKAFASLERETGRTGFRLNEVLERVRQSTSAFQESTIRTYVMSVMCADAPVHHANHTDDLVRIERGLYRRAITSDEILERRKTADQRVASPVRPDQDDENNRDVQSEWHWEGNVQAEMVRHLASREWAILSVANTANRDHGIDIIATKQRRRLLVEVKGYPSRYYAARREARSG